MTVAPGRGAPRDRASSIRPAADARASGRSGNRKRSTAPSRTSGGLGQQEGASSGAGSRRDEISKEISIPAAIKEDAPSAPALAAAAPLSKEEDTDAEALRLAPTSAQPPAAARSANGAESVGGTER